RGSGADGGGRCWQSHHVPPGHPSWCCARHAGHTTGGSGRVGPAHPAAPLRSALVLVEPAPGTVLLGPGDRVRQALPADRARGADGLGLALTDVPLRLALAVGAEEENDILATARGSILPAPVRPGRQCHLPTHLRHESISSGCAVCSRPGFLPGTRARAPCGFAPSLHPTHYPAAVFPAELHYGSGLKRHMRSGGGSRCRSGCRQSGCQPFWRTASHFCEPTLNDATPAGGFAAGPENYGHRNVLIPPGVGFS